MRDIFRMRCKLTIDPLLGFWTSQVM